MQDPDAPSNEVVLHRQSDDVDYRAVNASRAEMGRLDYRTRKREEVRVSASKMEA